jgi:hypothetical protein
MKTYFDIEVFGRRILFQKDILGSYQIGFYKKNPIPGIGRKALEELDNNLCSNQEMVRALIDPRFYRGSYPKDDVIAKAVENMVKAVTSAPAKDISEPMKPIILSKEEKERYEEVLKKAEQVIIDLKGDKHNVTKQMYGI